MAAQKPPMDAPPSACKFRSLLAAGPPASSLPHQLTLSDAAMAALVGELRAALP
jgi:hypothetical protein